MQWEIAEIAKYVPVDHRIFKATRGFHVLWGIIADKSHLPVKNLSGFKERSFNFTWESQLREK